MFKGHHVNTINEKGRLSIPSKFRDRLNECGADYLVVTKGLDLCLWVFTPEEWERTERIMAGLSAVRKVEMAFKRHIIGSAEDCPIDAQGRILIPMSLRTYANLKKKCLILGLVNRIEIWDYDIYNRETGDILKNLDEHREFLAGLGL